MKTSSRSSFKYYLIMLFLNSFVDLGHKITIQNVVFKVYDGQQQIILIAIVNSLILLPFVLLFTPSAYFSNRFALIKVMRFSAWVAVGCAALITYFYYQGYYHQAFIMTLVLATQSAIYSPAKYGYIKQLMGEAQLVMANARVQVMTILAILSGTLIFSFLFEKMLSSQGLTSQNYSESTILQAIAPLGWLLLFSTTMELWMAYRLPALQKPSISTPFIWSDYFRGRTLKNQISAVIADRSVFYAIVGLSLFWGLSQMVLAAFPAYAKQTLFETNTAVIQTLLACSGLGILLGAMFVGRLANQTMGKQQAEWQSRKQMIPFGAVGVAICLAIVPFVEAKVALGLCFLGVGLFGAFFIVPLNAIIQSLAPPERIGTILAGNNWLQNISMLCFLGLTIISAALGLSAVWLFYLIGLIAIVGSLFYLRYSLRDFLQFVLGGAFKWRYQIKSIQEKPFPSQGAVLLLGNHISWIDWAIIQLVVPRPIRYVIDRPYYEHWLLFHFLRHIKTVSISPKRSKEAIGQIRLALEAGDVICLFPEGQISSDGELNEFKAGFVLATKNTDTQIVPFYLHGLSGSRFSRVNKPRSSIWSVLWGNKRELCVALGQPQSFGTAEELQEAVTSLKKSITDSA